jgi:hypothetical protein
VVLPYLDPRKRIQFDCWKTALLLGFNFFLRSIQLLARPADRLLNRRIPFGIRSKCSSPFYGVQWGSGGVVDKKDGRDNEKAPTGRSALRKEKLKSSYKRG